MGYLLTAAFGAALVTATAWKPAPPPQFRGLASLSVPNVVDGLSGTDEAITPDVKAALPSADLVSRAYGGGAARTEFLMIAGTDRTALHDPRSCLVGAGWTLEGDHVERLPATNTVVRACHAVGLPDTPGFDILYLYVVDGRVVNDATQIRGDMLWSALVGARSEPVYFLRFMRPLDADAPAQAADHASLAAFASRMWVLLSPKLIRKS